MSSASSTPNSPPGEDAPLTEAYRDVRRATEALCEPLAIEDYGLQSMPDASPAKWHLAHTTWFFETFVLAPHRPSYQPFHPQFRFLFNSYYHAAGPRYPRPQRGLISRPTVAEVYRYRAYVDEQMIPLLEARRGGILDETGATIRLGLHHEQQHQELLLTDLKHAWSVNPLHPCYREAIPTQEQPPPARWVSVAEQLAWIGHDGSGFAFDNESPRHRVYVQAFHLASRLTTNAEYLAFMADGGYDRPELWLSDGWAVRQTQGWTAPLYWEEHDGEWSLVTLAGLRPLQPTEPVCHVSYYEADAFARWAGARLPTEAEWEVAAAGVPLAGHFLEGGRFHPAVAPAPTDRGPLYQLHGDLWQWTSSSYVAYPGYRPSPPATNGSDDDTRQPIGFSGLSEYNAKFFVNNIVLRGSSCVTPASHSRLTYRNFFPPHTRWQFSGIRLAKDAQ
jgi:ergothioneine biosynthesis protein EgtB